MELKYDLFVDGNNNIRLRFTHVPKNFEKFRGMSLSSNPLGEEFKHGEVIIRSANCPDLIINGAICIIYLPGVGSQYDLEPVCLNSTAVAIARMSEINEALKAFNKKYLNPSMWEVSYDVST